MVVKEERFRGRGGDSKCFLKVIILVIFFLFRIYFLKFLVLFLIGLLVGDYSYRGIFFILIIIRKDYFMYFFIYMREIVL